MPLAFIREDTTSPKWSCWTLCNAEPVTFADGHVEDVPAEIYGSVLTPADFNEAEARAEFRRKKAQSSAILSYLDALIDGADASL